MATSTTRSRGITILVGLSTPRSVIRSQLRGSEGTPVTVFGRMREAAYKIETRNKRRAEELASKSGSSSEEEEE